MGPRPEKPSEKDRAEETPGGEGEQQREPHHELNNPARDPDPTEWPDPYEKRDDPLDPEDPDHEPFGEEPRPGTGDTSTSQPHPSQDPEAVDPEGKERDKRDR
jgi:hypothetical protein